MSSSSDCYLARERVSVNEVSLANVECEGNLVK